MENCKGEEYLCKVPKKRNYIVHRTSKLIFHLLIGGNSLSRKESSDSVFTWTEFGSTKGISAAIGTIQGEMVVPKFFPRKGPRGTYSHAWMSLAEHEQKCGGYGYELKCINQYKGVTDHDL